MSVSVWTPNSGRTLKSRLSWYFLMKSSNLSDYQSSHNQLTENRMLSSNIFHNTRLFLNTIEFSLSERKKKDRSRRWRGRSVNCDSLVLVLGEVESVFDKIIVQRIEHSCLNIYWHVHFHFHFKTFREISSTPYFIIFDFLVQLPVCYACIRTCRNSS